MALKYLFSKELQKIAQWLGVSPSNPFSLGCLLYIWNTLVYATRLLIKTFLLCVQAFSLLAKSWLSARSGLLIFHSTISLSHKKFLFQKNLMMSFVVWAPQSKMLAMHMLKTLYFGLNFESSLAQGRGKLCTLPSAIYFVVNYKLPILEELTGDFCFAMQITRFRSNCTVYIRVVLYLKFWKTIREPG